MSLRSLLKLFEPPTETAPLVKLEGPFLPEDYALHNRGKYKSILSRIAECNLNINRDILISCNDTELTCRDNSRISLGLLHHVHNLEICYKNKDYKILAIDRFILLNPKDCETLKKTIQLLPLTLREMAVLESKK